MMNNYYIEKLRHDGLGTILRRRIRWYVNSVRYGNRSIGRSIERLGNRVFLGGMWFSVDLPAFTLEDKCTIQFGEGHEAAERRFIRRYLPRDLPVIEFGGAMGVTACYANRRLEDPTRHVVFEPNPAMRSLLKRNRALNRCRFEISDAALGYGADCLSFGIHNDPFMCKLPALGECQELVRVPAVTLAEVLARPAWRDSCCSVVCDIEGGELGLIQNELPLLANRCRCLLLEIHAAVLGEAQADWIVRELTAAGFVLKERINRNWAFLRPVGPE
jgi:FkbM family methyltransferase